MEERLNTDLAAVCEQSLGQVSLQSEICDAQDRHILSLLGEGEVSW